LAAAWFFFAQVAAGGGELLHLQPGAAIKHFLPQVEGRVFQLWTDHKPLVAAMKRVTPPVSGQQQLHLAFISEHTCDVWHTPGVDNVVADTLSHPPSPPPPPSPVFSNQVQVVEVAAAAVADADLSPLDIKEMALQQILCPQVQKLLHQPGLKIGFKQVDDLKLWGTCRPARSGPWYRCRTAVRYLTTCTAPPTLAAGRHAASSAPGMYGVAWQKM
jgi:hypothetical protein